jgi:hypothetical protein
MKRAELELGKDYYWDGSPDWAEGRGWRGQRVTYASEECFESDGLMWSRHENTIKLWDGTEATAHGLYRAAHRRNATMRDQNDRIQIVPVAHLRGPYDQCKAIVDEKLARRQQAREAARNRDDANRERAAVLVERCKALGLPAGFYAASTGGLNGVPFETLEALLDQRKAYARAAINRTEL